MRIQPDPDPKHCSKVSIYYARVSLWQPRLSPFDSRVILHEPREILYELQGWAYATSRWYIWLEDEPLWLQGETFIVNYMIARLSDCGMLDQIIFELSDYRNIEYWTSELSRLSNFELKKNSGCPALRVPVHFYKENLAIDIGHCVDDI